MRYTQATIGRKVDRLGELRRRLHALQRKADDIVSVLLRTQGGKGRRFVALLVPMPKKVVVVKAHKQVRTYPRPTPGRNGG